MSTSRRLIVVCIMWWTLSIHAEISQQRPSPAKMPRRATTIPALPPTYAEDPSAPPMLRYQASLPRLPVPPLESTCAKYLETVQPLLTPEEYSKTTQAVASFLSSPLAAELQQRLKDRAAAPETTSWLIKWWNDAAYLGFRDPVVVNVSYFFVHRDDRYRRDSARRAASLIRAMIPFRDLVERYLSFILACPSLSCSF